MDISTKKIIWGQFGAAIDTLENAINNCPDDLWFDNSQYQFHQYWYIASHTLFWLDYYLTEKTENFKPPTPFGMEEMDPAGVIPDPPYGKEQLLAYLEHGRNKCKEIIFNMTDELAEKPYKFRKGSISFAELLLYNMRHVQHHAAQLNLILRQKRDIGSPWVFQAKI